MSNRPVRPIHAFVPGTTVITKRSLNRDKLMPIALKALAEGKTEKEAAALVGVSAYTVHKWKHVEKQRQEAEANSAGKPRGANITPAPYARGYVYGAGW